MRRTLFRYRSFNTEKLNDYSYIHQRIINIEKWKFEAFEGLVYPSSPLYFNDPYDCEFCFQSDALEGVLDRETYIHLLERRFSLKQEEKNRILYSDNIERAMQIVLQAHGGRLSDSWMNILQNGLNDCMSTIKDAVRVTDSKYTYLFVTTHSPFVLYEMDNVNLVRIYSERKINSISTFYKVPDAYEKNRKMLNRCLSEAIFANKVLLVEGPSEYMLFSKVLSVVHPFYEVDGIYILPVDGVGFETYFSILDELEIFNVVKTDNDLRAVTGKGTYSVLGFSRCNNYIGEKRLPTKQIQENSVSAKRSLYNSNINTLDKIRSDFHIFLSKVDLENDLDEFLHDRLSALLDNDNPVKYLQDAKHYHMVELIEKLSDTDCRTIYNHYNFACLKEVAE